MRTGPADRCGVPRTLGPRNEEAHMLQKLTGDVQGPLEVTGSVEINGTLHGGAVVTGQLALDGTCNGPIEVRLDGRADVDSVVHGDVHARGGTLRIRGVIDG